MASYIFFEPSYINIGHLLNDAFSLKQGKAGRQSGVQACPVRSFKPKLDVHEDTEKKFLTATFDLPGFSKDEVQLSFQNGKLTVSAEIKKSEDQAESGYTLRERLHGKFSRTLQLPRGVQDEQIKAIMENGVLTVTYPKSLPEVEPKKIVIQTSDKEDYDTDFSNL